ncbi:MAG: pyridoxal phosphate-dependent aminotransferase [Pseudomonadota bacterium]
MNDMERSGSIPVSALHEVHREVGACGPGTIALHVGEAHIGIPERAREAFIEALRQGRSSYCDAPGLAVLRERLAETVSARTATDVDPDLVFVTPGSCQAISAVLASIARDGASVLLPDIHWPMHLHQILMHGLRPRFYSLTSLEEDPSGTLDHASDGSVRAIIVCSPSNPTGQVLRQETVERIHEWSLAHGAWVLSDEAYEDFVFEGEPARMAAIDARLPERDRIVFSIRTFSKSYSMTGYRLGYAIAPNRERAGRLLRVQEATLVAPCTPVQYAGLAALECTDHVAEHHRYVRGTRDAVLALLAEEQLAWIAPQGGWYVILTLGRYTRNAQSFCRRMLAETGVAIAPGESFGPPGHKEAPYLARLAFCREREFTLEGVRRIVDYVRSTGR